MRKISLKSPTVLAELNQFSDWFFGEYDYSVLDGKRFVSENAPCAETAQNKFLQTMLDMGDDHDGFPPSMRAHELTEFSGKQEYDPELVERVDRLVFGMEKELCVNRNALAVYYPADGYIGWHTNWNVSGYNILFTYSLTGDGEFKYLNTETNEIVTIPDQKGWTAKVGYYGSQNNPTKHCWHAATTNSPRLTFAYMVKDKSFWEMTIDDLEDN
jgi:hypothetical protein